MTLLEPLQIPLWIKHRVVSEQPTVKMSLQLVSNKFLEFSRRISRLENLYEESTKTETSSREPSEKFNSLEAGEFPPMDYESVRRQSKSN